MGKKGLVVAIFTVVSILTSSLYVMVYRNLASIPELFRLNAQLKSAGYYMGEFEFKMIGIVYYLDKGQYLTALSMLNKIQQEMKSKDGLVKIPKLADKKDELEFYLGLQNPRTGAFMNDSYPLCTYVGPTFNVINHLLNLANEVGQPLQLKYPLRFLDQINTGEKLKAYLDDLSSVGWIASRLPKTPNILAFEIAYYNDIESNGLYTFSHEWKKALLEWFYENQDRQTGYWGPRSRSSGYLLNSGDLAPSCHIARLFVDDRGNDRHPGFPLRYKDEMFATTLRKLSEPMPEDLADQHDWSLSRERGIRLLTNF